MKLLRIGMVLAAGFGGVGFTATLVAGCSADDTVVPQPDAQPDVTIQETGSDAPLDAKDAAPDVGPDVAPDAGYPVADFIAQQLKLTCQRYGQCCFGSDAGAFDQSKCEGLFLDFGWEGNLSEPAYIVKTAPDAGQDGGPPPPLNITIDPVNAQKCLAALATFDCPTIKAADDVNIFTTCYSAVKGSLTVGQNCRRSVECTTGNYCKPGDGGTTCQPIESIGAQCDQASENLACQYRGYLGTPARCDVGGTKKCAAKLGQGVACNYNWDCASGVCNAASFTCDTSTLTTTPGLCDLFKK